MIPLEAALAQPLAAYPLDLLRTRLLWLVVVNHSPDDGVIVASQMAFETEIGVILSKLITPSPNVPGMVVSSRRRFLDVDMGLRQIKFLIEPSLDALADLKAPDPYVDILRRHLASDYPRYRTCAVAALVAFAEALS